MNFDNIISTKLKSKHVWLVTGAAGFIGSNLVSFLLQNNQVVRGLDNFTTGHRNNLDEIKKSVSEEQFAQFTFLEANIHNLQDCVKSCVGVDFVLHHAALGSVPQSIENPAESTQTNVSGFVNMAMAAREAKVKRFVYASSSSVYGDIQAESNIENKVGQTISPYALAKFTNELYADLFGRLYGLETIGLRYFNVFGPRQDPRGAYAAVVPLWIANLIQGKTCQINGDGNTTRDFCFIENVIQANLLACFTENRAALNQVYNIACGESTSLNQLFSSLKTEVGAAVPEVLKLEPQYKAFRAGDIQHSRANIEKAKTLLGYDPVITVREGLHKTVAWYLQELRVKNLFG